MNFNIWGAYPRKSKSVILFLVLAVSGSMLLLRGTLPTEKTAVAGNDTILYLPFVEEAFPKYYVSKMGNNGDGKSWATAWNELDQIDWSVIQPGYTIVIDGGSSEMVYRSTLSIEEVHGTAENPITIRRSNEQDRNGRVVIFGGRSTPLPYCDQSNYTFQSSGVNSYGVYFDDASWIIIDGEDRSGIVIYGHNRNGMRFNFNTNDITTRRLEIYDNGFAEQSGGIWDPDSAGVRIAGANHTFEKMIIHDNGQDAFQSGSGQNPEFNLNNLDNLTIRQSWLYNGRQHPTVNESYNYCAHTDGVQINRGGIVDGVTIEETIIGPGFTNGVLLGQSLTNDGAEASIHNLYMRDVLFMKAADNSIRGYVNTNPTNWVIENVTSHCPQTKGHCLYIEGNSHAVISSIFVDAAVTLPDFPITAVDNCQWDTSGIVIGTVADPQFNNVNGTNMFSLDNYTANNGSCLDSGSSIIAVGQLLSLMDN